MNKFIKEQLQKVTKANLPDNLDQNVLNIPKLSGVISKNDNLVGLNCQIALEDYIIHPYEGFDLHVNWNNNIVPTDNIMNVEIVQQVGKMLKITGIGIHDSKVWSGWVPKSSIKIIERL